MKIKSKKSQKFPIKSPIAKPNKYEKIKKKQALDKKYNVKKIIPFSEGDEILLVGEGNFSFASALCHMFSPRYSENELEIINQLQDDDEDEEYNDLKNLKVKITATSYDSREIAAEKYPDLDDHLQILEKYSVCVLFNVDGRKLGKIIRKYKKAFDKIVFNFPHVGLGIKDQQRNVKANQELIHDFLVSCAEFLKSNESEVHITSKCGIPYDLWNIKLIAKTLGYTCKTSFAFNPCLYPGYAHRRTIGFKDGLSKEDNEELKSCRTFIFCKSPPIIREKVAKRTKRSHGLVSDSSDSEN